MPEAVDKMDDKCIGNSEIVAMDGIHNHVYGLYADFLVVLVHIGEDVQVPSPTFSTGAYDARESQ